MSSECNGERVTLGYLDGSMFALYGDRELWRDTVTITRPAERNRFIRSLCDTWPATDRADVAEQAELLAGIQAVRDKGRAKTGDGTAVSADGFVKLGQRDPATGRIVLSPKRTLPTAEAAVREFGSHNGVRAMHHYSGVTWRWRDNHYAPSDDDLLRHELQPWLHNAMRYVRDPKTGELSLVDFESNSATIESAMKAIIAYAHLPADRQAPFWTDFRTDPAPSDLLPCRTMTLHIPTRAILPATPALFTPSACDFDYVPNPPAPRHWLAFLSQLWPDDPEQITALQEWFGYCLTPCTEQQKALLLVGPKRSGKGTIARILRKLLGESNTCSPTTGSLAGAFGLQPLIGKTLAVISDARFSGDGVATVTERLLTISGEDPVTIDRKYLESVTTKLPTRFMLLTNELPRMTDASGALASRFIVLKMRRSFYGEEDVQLTRKLAGELAGILEWSLQGWTRLRDNGALTQPASTADAVQEMTELSSPVLAFVRDRCVVDDGERVWVDDLYAAWRTWCESEGRNLASTKQVFGRDLSAAVAGIAIRRNHDAGRYYTGIGLKGAGL